MTSPEPAIHAGTASELAEQVPESLRHLREALQSGAPWHQALLEAVGLWTLPQEDYQDRKYQYLIGGEAFDWLLLAERLCPEMDGAITQEEKEKLLFDGQLPAQVTPEIFRDLLGTNKYRGYLNYWYGVVVEEALQLSVEEEVRKRQIARCYPDSEDLVEDAYTHIYSQSRAELLVEFRHHAAIPQRRALSLADLKEFTYWLHKRRLEMWDPARVASDTRKGAQRLRQLEESSGTTRVWSTEQAE
ncbi:MAG: hypothetical protein BZY88_06790 [SAR202 cluster bacterium Io17-Chloro-G9]|nr:MAG: hypothetical protein BZY88_06790 [SAR202 cluster bacterium Io17-Chloro-G9]